MPKPGPVLTDLPRPMFHTCQTTGLGCILHPTKAPELSTIRAHTILRETQNTHCKQETKILCDTE